jgi:hypothetical protein
MYISKKFPGARLISPDFQNIAGAAVVGFMSHAGERLQRNAVRRLGRYSVSPFPEQWKPLAPSTLRKKRSSLRGMGKSAPRVRSKGGEAPLIDKGDMGKAIVHSESGFTATVTADFPAAMHEQDSEIGDWKMPPNNLPARPFLGSALTITANELIDPLERLVAGEL